MGSKFKVPTIFSLEWAVIIMVLAVVLAIVCRRQHTREVDPNRVRLLPYQGLMYFFWAVAILMFVQAMTHVLAMLA